MNRNPKVPVGRTGIEPAPRRLKVCRTTLVLTSLAFFWPVFHGLDLLFHWFLQTEVAPFGNDPTSPKARRLQRRSRPCSIPVAIGEPRRLTPEYRLGTPEYRSPRLVVPGAGVEPAQHKAGRLQLLGLANVQP